MRILWLMAATALVGACFGGTVVTSQPTTTVPTTTTVPATTTTSPVPGPATLPFSVPLGEDGITYEIPGSPPSGPSSFAVLGDGSVVIADTMALRRGDPRVLRYGIGGQLADIFSLAAAEAASIVDVASDGERIAVLDVYVATERYRVLILDESGVVETMYQIPEGFHFENGLTGIVWDDLGVLVEMEGGTRYARVSDAPKWETTQTLRFHGIDVAVSHGPGRLSRVEAGPVSFDVRRRTELGGASLIGIAPDGSILLVVDEVDLGEDGLEVLRRVQRYTGEGVLLGEVAMDAGEQYVEVSRTLEVAADGAVAYLVTLEDRVEIRILDV
jgi:hypothetical protein